MAITRRNEYRLTTGDKEIFRKAMNPNDSIGVNWFTSYYFGGRELRPWQWLLHHAAQTQCTVVGGTGCIASNTILEGQTKTIKELADDGLPIDVLAFDTKSKRLVVTMANAPYCKGTDQLYKIEFSNGKEITVTDKHKFLTKEGYLNFNQILSGDHVVYGIEHGLPDLETRQDFQYHYSLCSHQYDEQPPRRSGIDQDVAPLPTCVHAHDHDLLLSGVHQGQGHEYNTYHHCDVPFSDGFQATDYRLSQDFCGNYSVKLGLRPTQTQRLSMSGAFQKVVVDHQQTGDLKTPVSLLPLVSIQSGRSEINQGSFLAWSHYLERNQGDRRQVSIAQTYDTSQAIQPELVQHNDQQTFNLSSLNFNDMYFISEVHIVNVTPTGVAGFYDLNVPTYNNYVAQGSIHHNSGKTIGAGLSYATWAATTPNFSFMNLASLGPPLRRGAEIKHLQVGRASLCSMVSCAKRQESLSSAS